jgi:ABC-2 type transport system permease protein
MRNFMTLWRRELAANFLSPVAYVVTALYLLVAGWTFMQAVQRNLGTQESPEVLLFAAVFFWMPLFVTTITMRLFAEEKRSGTIEALMTAPVTDVEVVLAKFAGAWAFLLLSAIPVLIPSYTLVRLGAGSGWMDAGGLIAGCLLLVVIAAACVAIGLFVSLLTRNQIVAAVCCFCAICSPFLVRPLLENLPFGSDRLLDLLAADTHISDFSRGSIDTRPLLLYVSVTGFFLFASVKVLESRRWR